ncbi:MAG: hypothetical protein ACE5HP_09195 [Gemmatimonadota bacterium]
MSARAAEGAPDGSGVPRLGRPRLLTAELTRGRGARVQVRVALELRDREHEEERHGVGDNTMILRLAAQATLAALHAVIGGPARFELVGVKRVHAFDEDVILTGVRLLDDPSRRLLGCVPVGRHGLAEGTARSLLNATNRIVEWLPLKGKGKRKSSR